MTKGELVSLAWTRISGEATGGNELDVHRVSVRKFLEAALRYNFIVDYRNRRMDMARFEGIGESRMFSPLATTFLRRSTVDIVRRGRPEPYVVLPHLPMQVPGNHWLGEVWPVYAHDAVMQQGDFSGRRNSSILLIESLRAIRGIDTQTLRGSIFAYPEVVHGGPHDGRWILSFAGMNAALKQVDVRYVTDPSAIGDGEELLLPAGMEVPTLQLATDYFLGNRQMPEDVRYNDRDDAKQQFAS